MKTEFFAITIIICRKLIFSIIIVYLSETKIIMNVSCPVLNITILRYFVQWQWIQIQDMYIDHNVEYIW